MCHTYVDKDADLDTAIRVLVDAKTSYPAACNATECLLIHKSGGTWPCARATHGTAALNMLPAIGQALAAKRVVMHADPNAMAQLSEEYSVRAHVLARCNPLGTHDRQTPANKTSPKREYLGLEITVLTVQSVQVAHPPPQAASPLPGV